MSTSVSLRPGVDVRTSEGTRDSTRDANPDANPDAAREAARDATREATRPHRPREGRSRVVIENIVPLVDAGRFPAKRSVGEVVRVEADAFVDGHDRISVALRHRAGDSGEWHEVDMSPLVNDWWVGEFEVYAVGWHELTIVAWVDHFATWRYDLQKRVAAGQNVAVDLQIGAGLIEDAAAACDGEVARSLSGFAAFLRSGLAGEATEVALSGSLQTLMRRHAPRRFATESSTPVKLWV